MSLLFSGVNCSASFFWIWFFFFLAQGLSGQLPIAPIVFSILSFDILAPGFPALGGRVPTFVFFFI